MMYSEEMETMISKLDEDIQTLKVLILQFIDENCLDDSIHIESLMNAVKKNLITFTNNVKKSEKLREPKMADEVLVKYAEQLEKYRDINRILSAVVSIYEDTQEVVDNLIGGDIAISYDIYEHALSKFESIENTEVGMHFIPSLENELEEIKLSLNCTLITEWSKCIQWKKNPKTDTVELLISVENLDHLKVCIEVMQRNKYIAKQLSNFKLNFHKHIITLICQRHHTLEIDLNDGNNFNRIYTKKSDKEVPLAKMVDYISMAFKHLSFLYVEVLGVPLYLYAMFGRQYKRLLTDTMFDDALHLSIRLSENDAHSYGVVLDAVIELEKYLFECQFLMDPLEEDGDDSMEDGDDDAPSSSAAAPYIPFDRMCITDSDGKGDRIEDIARVDEDTADESEDTPFVLLSTRCMDTRNVLLDLKECKLFLSARTVIMQNTTLVIKVTNEFPFGIDDKERGLGYLNSTQFKKLSNANFVLPNMSISQSLAKLIQLVLAKLQEAVDESNDTAKAKRYYQSARAVLEMYIDVFSIFIELKENKDIAQIYALHHNNCMYLSHFCMLLNFKCKSFDITFCDMVDSFHQSSRIFIKYLLKCTLSIEDTIESINYLDCLDTAENYLNCTKKIAQVTIQIKHLSNVWSILPKPLYSDSMCKVLDSMFAVLTKQILSLKDISSDNLNMLTTLLEKHVFIFIDIVLTKEAAIKYKHDSTAYNKIEELNITFGNTMSEIDERWCKGKGITSKYFKKYELKNIIRAVFQNTDRRSTLLSSL